MQKYFGILMAVTTTPLGGFCFGCFVSFHYFQIKDFERKLQALSSAEKLVLGCRSVFQDDNNQKHGEKLRPEDQSELA